jgi:hypothetical protein
MSGKKAESREAHFLERATHADTRAAVAGDPEAKRAWSDMAALYRQLAALAMRAAT